MKQLVQRGGGGNHTNVSVRGGAVVTSISENTTDNTFTVSYVSGSQKQNSDNNNNVQSIVCDAVVLAVGIKAAQKLRLTCPPLGEIPDTARWDRLRGVTCVCVRLFFSRQLPASVVAAMNDSPVAVCGPRIGNIPELAETGFCLYDLQRMQDEFRGNPLVAGLEVDFFRADAILQRYGDDDSGIAQMALLAVSCALGVQQVDQNLLMDVSVVRARNAVSHFAVGSASGTPAGVNLRPFRRSLYICGDWIDRAGHSSWSTEKSVVTGHQAAAALAADFGVQLHLKATTVIPAALDTPQLQILRKATKWKWLASR